MTKEWTDEEVAEEISKAVQIVQSDKMYTLIRDRLPAPSANPNDPKNDPPKSGNDPNNDNGGNPNPGGNPTKKRSLWWGETE